MTVLPESSLQIKIPVLPVGPEREVRDTTSAVISTVALAGTTLAKYTAVPASKMMMASKFFMLTCFIEMVLSIGCKPLLGDYQSNFKRHLTLDFYKPY